MRHILAAATLFVCSGCATHFPVNTYGLVHKETTGITTYVLYDGKKTPIMFSPDSERQALEALRALKWNVFLPNTDGKHLFVTGELGKGKKFTPHGVGRPASEAYFDFRLVTWHLKTPFTRAYWKDGIEELPAVILKEQRQHLEADDFREFGGKSTVDLSRFEASRQGNGME